MNQRGDGATQIDPMTRRELLDPAREVLGRKWHPLVVDHLLVEGPARFSELEASIEGVSAKMLSQSLQSLEAEGIVRRETIDDRPVGVCYSLTDRGRSLVPVIRAMLEYGRQVVEEERAEEVGTLPTSTSE